MAEAALELEDAVVPADFDLLGGDADAAATAADPAGFAALPAGFGAAFFGDGDRFLAAAAAAFGGIDAKRYNQTSTATNAAMNLEAEDGHGTA